MKLQQPVIKKLISKQKANGSHFTPPDLAAVLARRIWSALDTQSGNSTLTVLDPACGDGELLDAFAESKPKNLKCSLRLVGVECDAGSMASAQSRFQNSKTASTILNGDFLDMFSTRSEHSLFEEEHSELPLPLQEQADVIIANPPYVRTQVLGTVKAQRLAKSFDLTGRVDLYHAFMVAMTRQLRPAGLIGVITSNRFLSTKGGESLRAFLFDEYELLEVMDLGDTKLFEAAVLPAILIARKKLSKTKKRYLPPKFIRIYEQKNIDNLKIQRVSSVCQILERDSDGLYQVAERSFCLSTGKLDIANNPSESWSMATTSELKWLKELEANTSGHFCDVAQVRVGIKTTADNVFIRSDWELLPENQQPEAELLRPLISSVEADCWKISSETKNTRRILYTHEVVDGKRRVINLDKYPRARNYLEHHRQQLEGRKYVVDAGRKWYEIWVPQNPEAWSFPKVIFPDISPSPKFFYDDTGALVDGNCYWLTLASDSNKDILFLLLALANSNVLLKYHSLKFQNKLYAGRRRFLSQYIERYPIPSLQNSASKKLIQVSKNLAKNGYTKNLTQSVNDLVAECFGIDPFSDSKQG